MKGPKSRSAWTKSKAPPHPHYVPHHRKMPSRTEHRHSQSAVCIGPPVYCGRMYHSCSLLRGGARGRCNTHVYKEPQPHVCADTRVTQMQRRSQVRMVPGRLTGLTLWGQLYFSAVTALPCDSRNLGRSGPQSPLQCPPLPSHLSHRPGFCSRIWRTAGSGALLPPHCLGLTL